MTKAEAAEIILSGDPFETCTACDGMGFKQFGGSKYSRESCTVCLPEADTKTGSGKVLKSKYAEAYAVAGIVPPIAKWSPPAYRDL